MTSVRSLGSIAWLFTVAACAAAPARSPSGMERSEAVPAGYEVLGSVRADCTARSRGAAVKGTPASSFLCNRGELERALVEQSESRGGTVLAAERCGQHGGGKLTCTAVAARSAAPAGGGHPRANASLEPERAGLSLGVAARILIDVEPKGRSAERRARPADEVTEFPLLPVGHVELGVMRAHCDAGDCDAEQARAGLLAAAGGLGVSALVGVRCFALDGEQSCVATLAATESDPETNPLAR